MPPRMNLALMVVDAVVAEQDRLAAIWARRGDGEEPMQRALEELLGELVLGLLDNLHPGALDADRALVTTTS